MRSHRVGCPGGENQIGGEAFDIFLWSAPSRVLKRIQGGEKDFSSFAEVKEKMKRQRVQQEERLDGLSKG